MIWIIQVWQICKKNKNNQEGGKNFYTTVKKKTAHNDKSNVVLRVFV